MNDDTARDVTPDMSVLHAKHVQSYTDGNTTKNLQVGNCNNGSVHLAAGGVLLILQTE
ncbi:hypothetical protein SAMN05444167_3824 [Terriglobus roseus]|uniref:Uncharacterized protein n=1 Tax=Terriglobus roseus TaxID=392734 RepID=A0A1G7QDH5_9BACT|nr:hypothetical protein SAMN05444167_3824 [Terriglobus roseus]